MSQSQDKLASDLRSLRSVDAKSADGQELLVASFASPNWQVRRYASSKLATLEATTALVERLLRCIASDSANERNAAATTISNWGHSAFSIIQRGFSDLDERTRLRVTEAFRETDDLEIIRLLPGLLKNERQTNIRLTLLDAIVRRVIGPNVDDIANQVPTVDDTYEKLALLQLLTKLPRGSVNDLRWAELVQHSLDNSLLLRTALDAAHALDAKSGFEAIERSIAVVGPKFQRQAIGMLENWVLHNDVINVRFGFTAAESPLLHFFANKNSSPPLQLISPDIAETRIQTLWAKAETDRKNHWIDQATLKELHALRAVRKELDDGNLAALAKKSFETDEKGRFRTLVWEIAPSLCLDRLSGWLMAGENIGAVPSTIDSALVPRLNIVLKNIQSTSVNSIDWIKLVSLSGNVEYLDQIKLGLHDSEDNVRAASMEAFACLDAEGFARSAAVYVLDASATVVISVIRSIYRVACNNASELFAAAWDNLDNWSRVSLLRIRMAGDTTKRNELFNLAFNAQYPPIEMELLLIATEADKDLLEAHLPRNIQGIEPGVICAWLDKAALLGIKELPWIETALCAEHPVVRLAAAEYLLSIRQSIDNDLLERRMLAETDARIYERLLHLESQG